MKRSLFWCFAFFLCICGETFAQPQGIVDRTFAENGYRLLNLSDQMIGNFSYTHAKILPNGDCFISGLHPSFSNDGNGEILFKIKANGQPDSSFNRLGYKKFGAASAFTPIYRHAVLVHTPNGKITVFSLSAVSDVTTIYRFKPNGTFDSTFGTNGVRFTSVKNFNSQYTQISYRLFHDQPDGKMLVGGIVRVNSANERVFIYRLQQNGVIDSTFGTNGIQEYLMNEYYYFKFITPAKNDSLFICGYNQNETKLKLIKIGSNGNQDMSFGDANGIASFYSNFGDGGSNPVRLVQFDDNRIFLAHSNGGVLATYFLQSNGLLDSSFYGTGSHKTFYFNGRVGGLIELAKLRNGEMTALVANATSPANSISTIKFKTTGTVDSSYGVLGITSYNVLESSFKGVYNGWFSSADSLKLFAFGQLVNGSTNYHASALRLNADAKPDSTYGLNGNSVLPVIASQDYLMDVESYGTGKTCYIGFEQQRNKLFLGRIDSAGNADNTFGLNGIKSFADDPGPVYGTLVKRSKLVTNAADTSVICVSYRIGISSFTIHKFNNRGDYDPSFADNGLRIVPVSKPVFTIPKVLQLPDGKFLVLIGSTGTPSNDAADILVVRLKTNGTRDSTFGTYGIVTIDQFTSFCTGTCFATRDFAKDIFYTSDNKIVVLGSLQGNASYDYSAMFRLQTNGAIDPGFGIITFFAAGRETITTSVIEQEQRKYIVSFNTYNGSTGARSSTVARFNYNGAGDPTFVTTSIPNPTPGGRGAIQNMSVQSDGKINVLCVSDPSYSGKPYIVRLKVTGTLDSTFGNNGIFILDTLKVLPATDVQYDNFTYFSKDVNSRLIAGAVGEIDQLRDVLFTRVTTGDTPLSPQLCSSSGNSVIYSGILGVVYQWQVDQGSGFVNISDDANYSGTNTMTLSLTGIPSSWYGYEYRCIVDGNIGAGTKLRFVNYWTGGVNTSWENPANWSCGTLPDANTDVVINSGSVIVLNSNATIRSLDVRRKVNLTMNNGFTLTVLH